MTRKLKESKHLIQNELDLNIDETRGVLNKLKTETDVHILEDLENQYKSIVKANFYLEKAIKQLNKSIKNIEKAGKFI